MMESNWYHLGIDGGGTRCRARLYTPEGKLIGSATAGPANVRLDSELVDHALAEVTSRALEAAGLDLDVLQQTKVGIGLAGILSGADVLKYSGYCNLFPHAILQSDSYIACLGAHNGGDGAILITGTGTSAMFIQHGSPHTLCSWGFRVADQGSGAQMGLLAIRTSLKAHDGIIGESKFTRSIMAKFGHSPATLVEWSETATPGDYAKFAPEIIEASKAGDSIARDITDRCLADFRDLINMLINKGAKKISLAGGLSAIYADWLPDHYNTYLSPPLGDPIDGAILMAKKQLSGN